jgi:hypothetical protein
MADGSRILYADPDLTEQEWELRAVGLDTDERIAIESVFLGAKGPLDTFTFLEPAGNLLVRSEEFGASAWDNDALVGVAGGIDDPLGTARAMRIANSSSVAGGVKQSCAVPGNFQYALSVWARTVSGSSVSLTAQTTGRSVEETFVLTDQWKRVSLRIALGQATESITFGAQTGAGWSVDLFGMQVEAQPAVSGYQKTGDRGGVHSNARFADDAMTIRAQGTDVYDAVIRIVSKGS